MRCEIDVNHRFSKGLSVRGVYTWSRALDDGDSLNGTAANNAPGLVSNPYDIRADWGPATYDATNVAVINAVYDLPFGHGQMFASDVSGWSDRLGERMVGQQHRHGCNRDFRSRRN